MNLHRKQQILEGKECHYVLINRFDVNGSMKLDENFPIELLLSNYFKYDAQIDFKESVKEYKRNEYLPFPFVTEEIELSDFKQLSSATNKSLIKELMNLYEDELGGYEYDNEFDSRFKFLIDVLGNALNPWEGKSDYFMLTIDDFERNDKKIWSLPQYLGQFKSNS